ncbi:MAG: UDP kinase [Polyangiaceae bacterium]|nr:UDP kinase [Polyangiaceae bacterium]
MLPLHFVVLLAGIQGLSEALPVSRSGHDVVAWIWLEPGANGARLETLLHLATAAALLFAARKRLAHAAGAGLRAIARPALFRSSEGAHDAAVLLTAFVASSIVRALFHHFALPWKTTPVAIGFGLLLTGLLLATTRLVGPERNTEITVPLALVLGLGHGMGALPGGSDIGAALVLAAWMGTKNDLALDLALSLSAGTLLVNCFLTFHEGMALPDIPAVVLIVGFVTAFLGTTVAIGATRLLLEKRALSLAAFWIVPLGLATLAYSRAFSEDLALALFTRPG